MTGLVIWTDYRAPDASLIFALGLIETGYCTVIHTDWTIEYKVKKRSDWLYL